MRLFSKFLIQFCLAAMVCMGGCASPDRGDDASDRSRSSKVERSDSHSRMRAPGTMTAASRSGEESASSRRGDREDDDEPTLSSYGESQSGDTLYRLKRGDAQSACSPVGSTKSTRPNIASWRRR